MRQVTAAAVLWIALSACSGTAEQGTGGASATGSATGTTGGGGPSTSVTGPSSSAATGGSGGATTSTGTGGAPDVCTDPAAKACFAGGQCTLATPSCCLCGMPELSDYVALNENQAAGCVCEGPACDCVSVINPNLAASCEGGTCTGWDVRKEDKYSACTAPSDCKLRNALDCCETCQGDEAMLVAVRVDAAAALSSALCSPMESCPKCDPQYPANASADCIGGHCVVVLAL